MSRKHSKNIAGMEAQRRELDREIRAAKRAEAKAAKERLLSERRNLGEWLAGAVGAERPEEVRRLRELLAEDDLIADLQRRLRAGCPDTGGAVDGQPTAAASGHIGPGAGHPISTASSDSSTVREAAEGGGHDDRVA